MWVPRLQVALRACLHTVARARTHTHTHTLHTVVSVTIRILMKACGSQGCGFFGSGAGFIYYEVEEGQVS